MLKFETLALCTGLTLMAPHVQADDTPPLSRMKTARALYDIGITAQDPLYILTAAQLRKSVDLQSSDRAPEGGTALRQEPLGWQEMLAMAAPLIAGDPAMTGLAEDIAATRSKGVASGPVYSVVEIGAGGRDKYPRLRFAGGKYAEIYVEGASGTDLNLLVHDAKGRLVCSDTDISAIAYCGWKPAVNGDFVITVENDGNRGGSYSMMTN